MKTPGVSPGAGWSFSGAELPWIHPWGLVLSVHAALGDRGPRWPSRITAARTRMEPPMYRMVLPLPLVEWGQKASPLGVRSHALGRKLSAKQTDEVPLRWLRAFIVAEARGAAFGEDLIRLAALRQSTFPIGGRLRNALRPASIRVVFKVDGITLLGRYQSQTESSPVTYLLNSITLGIESHFTSSMTSRSLISLLHTTMYFLFDLLYSII